MIEGKELSSRKHRCACAHTCTHSGEQRQKWCHKPSETLFSHLYDEDTVKCVVAVRNTLATKHSELGILQELHKYKFFPPCGRIDCIHCSKLFLSYSRECKSQSGPKVFPVFPLPWWLLAWLLMLTLRSLVAVNLAIISEVGLLGVLWYPLEALVLESQGRGERLIMAATVP